MAEQWWDDAPLVEDKPEAASEEQWWENAPLAEESSATSILGRSLMRGTADAIEGVGQSSQFLTQGADSLKPKTGPSDDPELDRLLKQSVGDGWRDPNWWIANTMTPLAGSSPMLAGAIGGAGLAGAYTKNPYGAAAGGAAGGAAGAAMQTLGPAYLGALQDGLSPDDAFERAWTQTGVASAFSAVAGALPMAAAFGRTAEGALKKPVKEALLQMFAVQPGVGVTEQAVQTGIEGKEFTLDDAAKAYIGEAVAGGVLDVGANLATGGYKTQTVTERGPSQEETEALAGEAKPPGQTPPAPAVEDDQAQALAGEPVLSPVERAKQAAARRAAEKAAQTQAPAPPAAEATEPPTANEGQESAAPPVTEQVTDPVTNEEITANVPEEPAAPQKSELFDQAVEAVRGYNSASLGFLRGRLKIGDAKARQLLFEMEDAGIISKPDARGNRTVVRDEVTAESNAPEATVPPDSTFVPEAPETIAAQQQALVAGTKKAVLYSADQPVPEMPDGNVVRGKFKVDGKVVTIDFNPKLTDFGKIQKAIKQNKLNELLELGPVNKQQVAESASAGAAPVAVTERTPDGTEVKAAAGTVETAPDQVQALEETKTTPENTIMVEDPEAVIAERADGTRLLADVSPEGKAKAAAAKEAADGIARKRLAAEEAKRTAEERAAEQEAASEEVQSKIQNREYGSIEDEALERLTTGGSNWTKGEKNAAVTSARIAKDVFDEAMPNAPEFVESGSMDKMADFLRQSVALARSRFVEAVATAKATNKNRSVSKKEQRLLDIRSKSDYETSTDHAVWLSEASRLLARLNNKGMSDGARNRLLSDLNIFISNSGLLKQGDGSALREQRREKNAALERQETTDTDRKDFDQEISSSSGDSETNQVRAEEDAAGRTYQETTGDEATTSLDEADVATGESTRVTRDEPVEEGIDYNVGRASKAPVVETKKRRTIYKRDAGSNEGPARELRADEVLQKVTFAEAYDQASGAPGAAINRTIIDGILGRLREKIGKVPVLVVSQKTLNEMYPDSVKRGGVDGYYDPQKNHIVVSESFVATGEFDSQLLAHEGLHAWLQEAINSNGALKKDIQQIMDVAAAQAAAKGRKFRGLKDIHEFISEAMSNPEFQNFLMGVKLPPNLAAKYDLPQGNLWRRFLQVVQKYLGSKRDLNALDYAIRLTERADTTANQRSQDQASVRNLEDEMRQRGLLSEGRSGGPLRALLDAGNRLSRGGLTEEQYDTAVDAILAKIKPGKTKPTPQPSRRTEAKWSPDAMQRLVERRLVEKYENLARFQKELADMKSGKLRDKSPREPKAPLPSDPDYEAKLDQWIARKDANTARQPLPSIETVETNIRKLIKSIEKDSEQLADIVGGNNRVQKPKYDGPLLSEGRQRRDFRKELTDAGVPDDVAAELGDYINQELGNEIDPDTLPLFMGDLIKAFAKPATSGGNAGNPPPPTSNLPGTPPPAAPMPSTAKGRATWIRGLSIKLNTLDYLRQKYNPYFNKLLDPYIKTRQKYENVVSNVSEVHDKDGAQIIELMRRDPKEATAMANLAMEATALNVRLGPNADNSHLGKKVKGNIQATQRLDGLNARFDQLKPETRKLYTQMTTNYRETHNNNIRALAYNLLVDMDLTNRLSNSDLMMLLDKTVNGTLTREDAKVIGEPKIYKELKRATSLRTIKGDYFPQMRFGDFVVLSRDKIADPGITSLTLRGNTRLPVKTKVTDNVISFTIDPMQRGGQAALNRTIKTYIEKSDLTLLRATKRYVDRATGKTVKTGEMELGKDYDLSWELEFQTRGVNFFESRADAQKFRDDLAKSSGAQLDELSEVLDRREDGGQFDKMISGSALTEVTKRIEGRKDIPAWQRKQMRAAVQEAIVSQMTGNRAQKRHMARRNVKGASKDIARSAVTYGQAAGNYYATLTTAGDLRNSFSAIEKYESDNAYKEGAGVRSQVMNELRARHSTMTDPLYLNKFVQNVAALSFFDKLVSPAYSIINFQQVIGNGLGYLGGKYGNFSTASAITGAYRKIGTLGTIKSGLKNTAMAVSQLRKSAIDTDDLIGSIRKNLGAKYEPLMDELIERGIVDTNSGFEIGQAIIDGSGPVNTGIAKFDRIARQLPSAVEAVNRTVIAVAAFDLATSRGKSVPDAIQEAYDAVANTQGDYRKSNNPRFMNNRFLSWALQFKKYAVLQTQLIGDYYARALKGATPEDRAIARKQLATHMAVQVAYAGAIGLPGLELLKLGVGVFAMLGLGDGWEEFEEDVKEIFDQSVGQTWSELLRKGVISRTLGVDVSQRMSQADLWTGFMPDKLDREGMMTYAGSLLLGAPGSTLFDWFDAGRLAVDGDIQKALEKAVPIKMVADTMRAVDQVQRGKMTPAEAVTKSIGFQPRRMANIGDEVGAEIREGRKVSDERKKLFREYLNATSKAEIIKLRARIREFNRKQGKDGRKLSIKSLEKYRREEMRRYSE